MVIFQSHLYSRTRDFLEDFARALSKADYAIIPPIYPAREENKWGVSNEDIARAIRDAGGKAEAALDFTEAARLALQKSEPDFIIATVGAGDVNKICSLLT